MRKSRIRRRPMSEINVVPYIDVMLVLLVIFMVTAPLITQGVKVELPRADAAFALGFPEFGRLEDAINAGQKFRGAFV